MPLTQQHLTDPKNVGLVTRLELLARDVVEGIITGMHQSPYRGFSVEFAQHREYTPGDEIRYVDWKVAARSDRYYVKEFEEETNLKAYLLVDTSESMSYKGRKSTRSKAEYAAILAAAMAALLIQQRDGAGLVTFSDGIQRQVPPRATASHLTQLLEELIAAQPKPKSALGPTFHEIAEQMKRRGLVIVISDMFGDLETILEGLRHFRYRRHEIIVLQVMDPDELTFPFDDLTKFEGLELEPEVLVDPRGIRDEYLRQMNDFCEGLERGCREIDADLVRFSTDQPPGEALGAYLARRMRR